MSRPTWNNDYCPRVRCATIISVNQRYGFMRNQRTRPIFSAHQPLGLLHYHIKTYTRTSSRPNRSPSPKVWKKSRNVRNTIASPSWKSSTPRHAGPDPLFVAGTHHPYITATIETDEIYDGGSAWPMYYYTIVPRGRCTTGRISTGSAVNGFSRFGNDCQRLC
jgi:hypothetical protein